MVILFKNYTVLTDGSIIFGFITPITNIIHSNCIEIQSLFYLSIPTYNIIIISCILVLALRNYVKIIGRILF